MHQQSIIKKPNDAQEGKPQEQDVEQNKVLDMQEKEISFY